MNDQPQQYPATRYVNREQINALPLVHWQGEVEVLNTLKQATQACSILRQQHLLGFDTETQPTFRKGQHNLPALLQLATEERVYIFQLHRIGLPPCVRKILGAEAICKVGVATKTDALELEKIHPFAPSGFLDLATMAKKRKIKNLGLRGLAAVVLGVRISKTARTSNWAVKTLTQQQIRYAATDAWIGREIYRHLLVLNK